MSHGDALVRKLLDISRDKALSQPFLDAMICQDPILTRLGTFLKSSPKILEPEAQTAVFTASALCMIQVISCQSIDSDPRSDLLLLCISYSSDHG